MARKIIGRFTPQREVSNLPPSFEQFLITRDGFNERLGIIPATISPQRLQAIRQEAAEGTLGRLYELYRKIVTTDARVGGIYGSAIASVAGLPLKHIRASGTSAQEMRIAEDYENTVKEAIGAIDAFAYVRDCAEAYFDGVRVFQTTYKIQTYQRGQQIAVPNQPEKLSGGVLRMETGNMQPHYGELFILTAQNGNGVPLATLDPRQIWSVEEGINKGFYDTAGALRRVLGWWIVKMYAQIWWAEYVETFGQPMRVGRFPIEAGPGQKAELKKFLREIGRNKYGLFPQGVDVQLLEANNGGNVTTFRDIINMANNEIAVAILGQTGITTDSAQGSRAKLEVLADVVLDAIISNIAKIVERGFDQLISAVLTVNYGESYIKRLAPKVRPLTKKQASAERVRFYQELVNMGIPVSLAEICEQTGLQAAEVGEMVVTTEGIQEFTSFEDIPASNPTQNGTQDNSED